MIISMKKYKLYKAVKELIKDMPGFLMNQSYDQLLKTISEARIRLLSNNNNIFELLKAKEIFLVGVKRGSPELSKACAKAIEQIDIAIHICLSEINIPKPKVEVVNAISEVTKSEK